MVTLDALRERSPARESKKEESEGVAVRRGSSQLPVHPRDRVTVSRRSVVSSGAGGMDRSLVPGARSSSAGVSLTPTRFSALSLVTLPRSIDDSYELGVVAHPKALEIHLATDGDHRGDWLAMACQNPGVARWPQAIASQRLRSHFDSFHGSTFLRPIVTRFRSLTPIASTTTSRRCSSTARTGVVSRPRRAHVLAAAPSERRGAHLPNRQRRLRTSCAPAQGQGPVASGRRIAVDFASSPAPTHRVVGQPIQ
jgi:hypothetical protein